MLLYGNYMIMCYWEEGGIVLGMGSVIIIIETRTAKSTFWQVQLVGVVTEQAYRPEL